MSNLTIKDIAKLCGVGKSTVSRVINHDPKVKESTRTKVLEVIGQYHFLPSKSARAMRGYHNKVVGIMVTRLDSYAENQAVSAMLPLLYQNGLDAIIVESQFNVQKVQEHLTMLHQRQVDGLITFAFSQLSPELFAPWQHKSLFIARQFADFPAICYDDIGAVEQGMNYLHQQKQHQKIGFLGINLDDTTTGQLRYQTYHSFCKQHQLPINAQLGDLNYQSGYQLAPRLLQAAPTAILCATDSLAMGLYKYLQVNGLTGIDICSIGHSKLLTFLYPDVISIELGFYEAGQTAATTLINLLAGQPINDRIIIRSKMAL